MFLINNNAKFSVHSKIIFKIQMKDLVVTHDHKERPDSGLSYSKTCLSYSK